MASAPTCEAGGLTDFGNADDKKCRPKQERFAGCFSHVHSRSVRPVKPAALRIQIEDFAQGSGFRSE